MSKESKYVPQSWTSIPCPCPLQVLVLSQLLVLPLEVFCTGLGNRGITNLAWPACNSFNVYFWWAERQNQAPDRVIPQPSKLSQATHHLHRPVQVQYKTPQGVAGAVTAFWSIPNLSLCLGSHKLQTSYISTDTFRNLLNVPVLWRHKALRICSLPPTFWGCHYHLRALTAHETWRIIPTHAATGSTRTFITPLGNKSGTASLFVVFVMPKHGCSEGCL
jgi:hypothetical protein